jgi:hypothetical protein
VKWVPDWEAAEGHTQHAWIEALDLYNASVEPIMLEVQSSKACEKIEEVSLASLLIDAGYLGEILYVGETMRADDTTISRSVLEDWKNMLVRHGDGMSWNRGDNYELRLWRVLCADVICTSPTARSDSRLRRTTSDDDRYFRY